MTRMLRMARSEPTSRWRSRPISSACRRPVGEKVAISLAASFASRHSSVYFWEVSRTERRAARATPVSPERAASESETRVFSSSR